MKYPQALESGVLIRRYKRFLADVQMDDGRLLTAHCANTGAMTHCADPGCRVWLLDSGNPKRKYRYSWEWTEVAGCYKACINTARANQLVAEALLERRLPGLDQWTELQREPVVEDGRLDFRLQLAGQADIWIEVKSVTLIRPQTIGHESGLTACFPDAVTARGLKHLLRLQQLVASGQRAVLLFCVALDGVGTIETAADIDPAYAQALQQVMAAGVEVLCVQVHFGIHNAEYSMHVQPGPVFADNLTT
jgi:sugar fermentation stimulation protein A